MVLNQKMEIIKPLAYGETPLETTEAGGISISEAVEILSMCAKEMEQAHNTLKKAGCIND